MTFFRIWLLAAIIGILPVLADISSPGDPADGRYLATAYNITGITASGLYTHRHIVAADPDVLPIGSIIRVSRAGQYSGEYAVADTGEKIQGRHIDIYIPSLKACIQFGVRHVLVQVIHVGKNTHRSAEAAYNQVKKAVALEIDRNTPGGAATAEDLAEAQLLAGELPNDSK